MTVQMMELNVMQAVKQAVMLDGLVCLLVLESQFVKRFVLLALESSQSTIPSIVMTEMLYPLMVAITVLLKLAMSVPLL